MVREVPKLESHFLESRRQRGDEHAMSGVLGPRHISPIAMTLSTVEFVSDFL